MKPYSSNIPLARETLRTAVAEFNRKGDAKVLTQAIAKALPLMHQKRQRQPKAREARPWKNVRPEEKAEIPVLYKQGLTQQQIAKQLGVNSGRIAEFLNGQRR